MWRYHLAVRYLSISAVSSLEISPFKSIIRLYSKDITCRLAPCHHNCHEQRTCRGNRNSDDSDHRRWLVPLSLLLQHANPRDYCKSRLNSGEIQNSNPGESLEIMVARTGVLSVFCALSCFGAGGRRDGINNVRSRFTRSFLGRLHTGVRGLSFYMTPKYRMGAGEKGDQWEVPPVPPPPPSAMPRPPSGESAEERNERLIAVSSILNKPVISRQTGTRIGYISEVGVNLAETHFR
eukprot:1323243-Amorphochlora_amoeboformis.AAC.1